MAESRLCSVAGCEKPPRPRRPMCSMHEARVVRTGTTEPGRYAHRPIEESYWKLVVVNPEGCWGWSGWTNNRGYGVVRRRYAHRLSFEIHHGAIPSGQIIMHACDNPPCLNPEHLRIGTQHDNMQDAAQKGRLRGGRRGVRFGESNFAHKLTAAEVAEIRQLRSSGVNRRAVADRFGVTINYITSLTAGTARSRG